MEAIILLILVIVVSILMTLLTYRHRLNPEKRVENPGPRIVLPTGKKIWKVELGSELSEEEWELIINAGWTNISSTTEQRKEYTGYYPEAPSYNKTWYKYVFHKK